MKENKKYIRVTNRINRIKEEIDRVYEEIKESPNQNIQIYMAITNENMKGDFEEISHEYIDIARESVSYTKARCDNVKFSFDSDSTPSDDIGFISEFVDTIRDAGAQNIKIHCNKNFVSDSFKTAFDPESSEIEGTYNDNGDGYIKISIYFGRDTITDRIEENDKDSSYYSIPKIVEHINIFYETNDNMSDDDFCEITEANRIKKYIMD